MDIPREEIIAQLEKVLNGRTLHGSESLKSFLRFVVEKSIEDDESKLKEYVIATEVFGRGKDFDSRIDSVVRVQAGRLRTKLSEYYAHEGLGDQIIIDLPKGQYSPVFSYVTPDQASIINGDYLKETGLRDESTAADPSVQSLSGNRHPVEEETADLDRSARSAAPTAGIWRTASIVLASVAVVFALTAFYYRSRAVESDENSSSRDMPAGESIDLRKIDPLWGGMLRSSEPVLVVFSNTLFRGTPERGMKLLKSLDSPGSSLGSPIIPQSEIEQSGEPVIEHYTGIGEVMGAYFLGDFFAKTHHSSRFKRSLLLTWEDLKTENIVVLGSPAENLFLRDLPQKQDFIFKPNLPNPDDNSKPAFGIVNTRPQPGEAALYFAAQGGPSRSQISEDYALVSLLQGLDSKNRLLILAGITTLGTQAAAEYVTKPEYIQDMISRLNTSPPGGTQKLPDNYQVLVKVKVNGGVPVQISYVTHHVLGR